MAIPKVLVQRDGPFFRLAEPCPFCGGIHAHGAKGGLGHRVAHCGWGGYDLIKADHGKKGPHKSGKHTS